MILFGFIETFDYSTLFNAPRQEIRLAVAVGSPSGFKPARIHPDSELSFRA